MPTIPPAKIVWFRRDLRLTDNPALSAALASGGTVVPVFIWDRAEGGEWPIGAASRWWLHHALAALASDLERWRSRLILRNGLAAAEIPRLAREVGADAVYWNRRYEPAAAQADARLEQNLRAEGVDVQTYNGSLLFEPAPILNRQGAPFKVFSAYWRYVFDLTLQERLRPKPKAFSSPRRWPKTVVLKTLQLLPKIPWDAGFAKAWRPGEAGAHAQLKIFLKKISVYGEKRDLPADTGSARLSPYLHFGEISPRQIYFAVKALSKKSGIFPIDAGAQKFLQELTWREFAYYLLHWFPQTPTRPYHQVFAKFPWAADPGKTRLYAWQRGRTGYPIVDAAMRELWATGWMPNRLRMITASFLVKHLLQPWTAGAAWFWDTLVDADLANNTLGWQWIAGSGADASPFFRIFAPVTQARKFDPKGEYVRRWLPELSQLPDKYIHAPWTAPLEILHRAKVELGKSYPEPIVDHNVARLAALEAFRRMRTTFDPSPAK